MAVESTEDLVLIVVTHAYAPKSEASLAEGRTTITLPRAAGYVGFAAPQLMPERWSGGFQRTLKSLGIQP